MHIVKTSGSLAKEICKHYRFASIEHFLSDMLCTNVVQTDDESSIICYIEDKKYSLLCSPTTPSLNEARTLCKNLFFNVETKMYGTCASELFIHTHLGYISGAYPIYQEGMARVIDKVASYVANTDLIAINGSVCTNNVSRNLMFPDKSNVSINGYTENRQDFSWNDFEITTPDNLCSSSTVEDFLKKHLSVCVEAISSTPSNVDIRTKSKLLIDLYDIVEKYAFVLNVSMENIRAQTAQMNFR